MFRLTDFVYDKYIIQIWIIVILTSTAMSLRANLFMKTAAAIPARLDPPQRHQRHKVLGKVECAQLCAWNTSCVDLQYSNTSGVCITGHKEDASDGQISQSGLFDNYRRIYKDPETCFEIKHNNPTAESGEYYIHPSAPQFQGLSVKVYCLMNDTHQLEYVTLPNRNFGDFPRRSNEYCNYERSYLVKKGIGSDGVTDFQKIRVQPSTMAVVTTDTTFTSGNKMLPLPYGQAEDCYSFVENCKRVGLFHINTLGTRMRFKNDLTWATFGYNAAVDSMSRQENGAIIDVVCGGFCGGCNPKGDMLLYPNSLDKEA